jgi:5'-phosphate synthase pdxT subunit
MFDILKDKIEQDIPVLATCAGLILLAKEIINDNNKYFATLPVRVRRNAYGRQLGSFETTDQLKGIGDFKMTFIRAPYIDSVDDGVDILAKVDEKIVAVQYKNQIGLSFHPELRNDYRIHQIFLDLIKQ